MLLLVPNLCHLGKPCVHPLWDDQLMQPCAGSACSLTVFLCHLPLAIVDYVELHIAAVCTTSLIGLVVVKWALVF